MKIQSATRLGKQYVELRPATGRPVRRPNGDFPAFLLSVHAHDGRFAEVALSRDELAAITAAARELLAR